MVEQPGFVLSMAGWLGAYAKMILEGGTYCPAHVQLMFRVWIPRMHRVGKVGVRVSFKWSSNAKLMLQDLAHLAN